jgi:hypothetical protein
VDESRHIGRSAQLGSVDVPWVVEPDRSERPDQPGERPDRPPEHEFRNASFTFEGQMERLQHWVVGINRRGGRDKRLVQIAVIVGLALLLLAYFSGIFWGLFIGVVRTP